MAECKQCFVMSDGSLKLCYECLEKRTEVLETENKDLKSRAEAAESDWQVCEERIKELEAEITRLRNIINIKRR